MNYDVLNLFPGRTGRVAGVVAALATIVAAGLVAAAPARAACTHGASMPLQRFDGATVPTNLAGETYPSSTDGRGGEGGVFTPSIHSGDAVGGSSLRMHLVESAGTGNALYAQFNPYDDSTRGFARDYSADPDAWQFDTYTRLSFWLRPPAAEPVIRRDGTGNANAGTYVKTVDPADPYSDESGGGHWYHNLNIPRAGTWVHVVLNMHPDHLRGTAGGLEHGNQPHPTGESAYNYFDALTRFYLQDNAPPPSLPADFLMDEIVFCEEPRAENDEQIRNIASTFIAADNRVIVTWFRDKDENEVAHEVRYAFADIHALGWDAASPAPGGTVLPPGYQGYNGMFYETTAIDVAGHDTLYLAIRPQNAVLFTQVIIPLSGPAANLPPVLGEVSASPHPAQVGQSVAFTAAAEDADGDAVAVTWDFGDGHTGSGAEAAHTYAAAGIYTASATAADIHGASSTGSVTVVVGDGAPAVLGIDRLRARVRFDATSADSMVAVLSTHSSALPASWDGLDVYLDVAGASWSFEMDARGRAGTGAARLRVKRRSDGVARWKLIVRDAALLSRWQDEGVVGGDVEAQLVTLPVLLATSGTVTAGEAALTYDARAGLDGRLR